jgi:hypothetical protein
VQVWRVAIRRRARSVCAQTRARARARRAHAQVGRLHVAVDEAGLVGCPQRGEHGVEQLERPMLAIIHEERLVLFLGLGRAASRLRVRRRRKDLDGGQCEGWQQLVGRACRREPSRRRRIDPIRRGGGGLRSRELGAGRDAHLDEG